MKVDFAKSSWFLWLGLPRFHPVCGSPNLTNDTEVKYISVYTLQHSHDSLMTLLQHQDEASPGTTNVTAAVAETPSLVSFKEGLFTLLFLVKLRRGPVAE